jgi:hypothetical protein
MLSIQTGDPDSLYPKRANYSNRWKETTIYGRTHILAI